ncbi:hypothetical protein C5B85_07300 [Pseudoclavibacter sp. AY1F1]|uniref:hypothetical protein n=1 Tax=Pseudoclavibacter sp. AY1F1 TaxID=2080583 RepID=UPI000CE8A556|nr:hypothetical protein [Pseudoclavibacter sp. AY1F1]PPF45378.1 hypothetical protein C5B85_07300 [Pseudoclavibacter sp. AY1F1]
MSDWSGNYPFEILGLLYAHGWIVAVVIAAGVLILATRNASRAAIGSTSPRERSVLVVLSVGSAVVFAAQEIVRDQAELLLVSSDWTTRFIWWKYVGPAAALVLVLIVGALLLRGARRDVEVRVPPFAARGWASFTGRALLVWACAGLSLLILVALFAGANSSQAADGHFRLLILSGNALHGNSVGWMSEGTDYFGWSYSGPTLATAGLAALACWCFLRENALRPYRNPSTVDAEARLRVVLGRSVLLLFIGTVLVTTAIVLRDMGYAGIPHGGILMEEGFVLPIGGEFEALSQVLLVVSALLRPIAVTLVLLGGSIGWLPELVAGRRRAARSSIESVAGASR